MLRVVRDVSDQLGKKCDLELAGQEVEVDKTISEAIGDPLTHLKFSENAHGSAAERLCLLADEYCQGRIVATGGGGYDRRNLARAWTRVVEAMAA